jgi:tRNA-splicing ligase RtcB
MKIFGTHDDNTIEQLREVAKHAEYVALMADGHLGYSMPIGGVAAYDNKVSVTGVGFDIACGNCAMKTTINIGDVEDHADAEVAFGVYLRDLGHWIQDNIAFGVGKENQHARAPSDNLIFDDDRWSLIPEPYRTTLRDKARKQLGSCGSGNHYVDILVDEDGFLWVSNHFGSRGFGHNIATAFINISQGGKWGDRGGKEGMCLLDLDTQAGQDYWDLMRLAGDYAYEGREWVNMAVMRYMGTHALDIVHNNHNFAWKELHRDGRELVVVRKGATPAFGGQRGFVGGSMGDDAVILEGRQDFSSFTDEQTVATREAQEASLMSTVHGAGRVMSRTAATGKNRRGKVKAQPRVDRTETEEWLANRNVLVYGAELDEAPQAYRRLPDVLRDQGDTVTVLHTLRPLVVVMAPSAWDAAGKPLNPFLAVEA